MAAASWPACSFASLLNAGQPFGPPSLFKQAGLGPTPSTPLLLLLLVGRKAKDRAEETPAATSPYHQPPQKKEKGSRASSLEFGKRSASIWHLWFIVTWSRHASKPGFPILISHAQSDTRVLSWSAVA